MSDDKTKRGPPDSNLISLTERWEVEYWTKRFEITEADLRLAVATVGHGVKAVEDYLVDQAER